MFQRNLAAIRERDKALAERLESLAPSPRITREKGAGRRVLITVNAPGGEGKLTMPDLGKPHLDSMGEALSMSRMVAALGLGSGRLFAEIVERTGPQTFVLLIEPDIDLFAAVIAEEDFSKAFRQPKVCLAVGEKPHAATIIKAESELSVFTITDCSVIENPWSAPLYIEYFNEVKDRISHLMKMGGQNAATLAQMDDSWRDNVLENLPAIIKSAPVMSLFGRFSGMPGVVVAAGPSLSKNIWWLGALKGRGVIIAVDTAVRALLSAGITPDIVVSLDSQFNNYLHLKGVKLPDTLMAFNPVSFPQIVKEHEGPMVFTGYTYPLVEWLETVIGELGSVRAGGSVATSAFDLAVKMGCSPVVLIGQDLCYSTRATHAEGTLYETETRAGLNTRLDDAIVAGATGVVDLFGREALALGKMEAWRQWFELVILGVDQPVFNATEGGTPIQGASPVSMAEVVARHGKPGGGEPALACMDFTMTGAREKEVAEALHSAREEARAAKSICGKGMNALKSAISYITDELSISKADSAMGEVKNLAREILEKSLFAELNRFAVESALDRVENIRRKSEALENKKDRFTMSLEAYRALFTEIYEIAAKFDKSVSQAIRSISGAREGGAGQ